MAPLLLLDVARDETLARRASSGDDRAFAALVARYQPRLERYCRSILRNDEDGRDAAQNTLTKALIALRTSGGPDRAVSPWLFRIAHNESISLLRKRREDVELGDELPVVGRGLHEQVELRADVAALLDGVAALSPRARHALLLREFAGLDHKSVGQVLGISPGAARQAVCEARASLRSSREAGRAKRLVLGLPIVGPLWSWISSLGAAGEAVSGGAVLGGKLAAAAAVLATSAPVVVPRAASEKPAEPAPKAKVVASAEPEPSSATTPVAPTVPATHTAVSKAATSSEAPSTPRVSAKRTERRRTAISTPTEPENDRIAPSRHHDDESWDQEPTEYAEDHHDDWSSAARPVRRQQSPQWQPQQPQQQQAPAPAIRAVQGRGSNPRQQQRQPDPQPAVATPQPEPAPTPVSEPTPEPVDITPEPTPTVPIEPLPTTE